MTLKQVFSSIIKIHEEIKNKKEFDANVHNQSINFKEEVDKPNTEDLTDAQQEIIRKDRENFFKDK